MIGTFAGCCARAASGHATAAPPISVMSDRLFTAGPFRASDTKNSTPQLRQEAVALRDFNFRYDRSVIRRCLINIRITPQAASAPHHGMSQTCQELNT